MFDMANFLANAIRENGLILPVNFTEEEFFEAGKALAKIEQGMQWAIGDWYNSIPWGDKEAACKAVGLQYETAKRYSVTCTMFPNGDRDQHLGFKHYQQLEIQDLTPSQRADLLKESSKNNWSVARLRHERDALLGRPQKVQTLEFDEQVDSLLEDLPAKVSNKAKSEIRKVYGSMKQEFVTTVEREVNKRLEVERSKLADLQRQAREELDRAKKMAAGITPVMTLEDFKFILGLLHPDKHPDNQERYNKAFVIFNRLLETIDPRMPIEVKRKRGWENL